MAEMQIKIAADVSSAVGGLNKLSNELDQTGKDALQLGNAVQNASQKIRTLPNVTGQATSTLTNFSRVVQDAPFGLIGIANNIDPLVTSFQQLKASTGTTGGALKALVGQLAGPAGIALAISTVTSLLIAFGGNLFKSGQAAKAAKSDIEDFNKSLDNAKASALSSGLQLEKFVEIAKNGNLPLQQRNEALSKANDILGQYGEKLTLTNIATAEATELVNQYTQGLIAQALANQLADRAATLLINQANAQKLVTEAQLAYNKAQAAFINRPLLTLREQELGRGQSFIIERDAALKSLNQRQEEYANITKEITSITSLFNEQALKSTNLLGLAGQKTKGVGGKINFDFELIPGISNLSEFEAKLAGPLPGLLPDLQKAIKNIQTDPKDVKIPVRPRLEAIGTNTAVLEFSTQLTQALQNALQQGLEGIGESVGNLLSGENFGEGILGVISSLLTAIGKALIAYGLAKDTIDKILAPTGATIPGAAAIGIGIATIAAATLLKNFGGPRAEGGPVSGNKTYLVGERGPELFVPNVAGTIVPNDELPSFGQGLASVLGGRGGSGTTLRGQDIILAYARTQRSQLRVNG